MMNKLSRDNEEFKCNLKFAIYYLIKSMCNESRQWLLTNCAILWKIFAHSTCTVLSHSRRSTVIKEWELRNNYGLPQFHSSSHSLSQNHTHLWFHDTGWVAQNLEVRFRFLFGLFLLSACCCFLLNWSCSLFILIFILFVFLFFLFLLLLLSFIFVFILN